MGFINTGKPLDDIPEEEAVPEGEYELEIINVGEPKIKEDTRNTVITCSIRVCDPDFPNARLVSHSMVLPSEQTWEQNQDTARMMMRNNKRFLRCFGVEWTADGFETEDLQGATGKCHLVQEEYQGEPVNKLRLPRLRE